MSDLVGRSAAELAEMVRDGGVTAVDVTRAHLDRITATNGAINSIVDVFPEESLEDAEKVDRIRAEGGDPGPMAGVPVTIKCLADQVGHATTNGLKLQKDLIATEDTPVVSNLRKAGAVIVGRTNTPAFSLRWFTRNDLHGQTLNPRDTSLTPGGSSGGASASVAAGQCAVGHGTDIAGSIRYPAYACGLHGLRPTIGRVPAHNFSAQDRFFGAQMMACHGPIAREMKDIALSFAAMAAPDVRDPVYNPVPLAGPDYPKRVALTHAPGGMPVVPGVTAALEDAAARLRDAGWEVDEVEGPPAREAAEINSILWAGDGSMIREIFEREGDADALFIIKQLHRHAGPVDFDRLMKAGQARMGILREWQMFMDRYPVILCPSSGQLPFPQQMDVASEDAFDEVFEAQLLQRAIPALGLPGLAVSTGFAGSAPVGVQLVAQRFREDILIAAGTDIEARGPVPAICTP
ncbi:amidase family protein [Chachezhania antarctica]|uniref:amidase family protein n=1 Tax=Chachezhania antarctica TaxID=2340860 RepID=UPI000EB2EE8B|nr:amidase family protein [Chachezhania antarctica]|tara:strand:- start:306 stop:1694 length:1389 start_codon:yes stop_codon:yes gene_type:complete